MRIPNAIKKMKKKNINRSCFLVFNTDFSIMAASAPKVQHKAMQYSYNVCYYFCYDNNETHMTSHRVMTPSFHTCAVVFEIRSGKACFETLYLKFTYIGLFIHNHSITIMYTLLKQIRLQSFDFPANAALNATVLIISLIAN